jgi:DNA-binding transcriptional regulator LsrR (DeoR family)
VATEVARSIRSKKVRAIEKRHGKPLEQILRELYYDEGLTQAEVGKRLRVPAGSVGGWLIRFGINQRALAEQAAKELSA